MISYINKMFNDVENALEKYESEQKDVKVLISIAVKALSGLADIL